MTAEILTEIISGLQIQSNFTICHPQHPNFSLSEQVTSQIQQSATEIRTKFLTQHLQSYLVGTHFTHLYRQTKSDQFANKAATFAQAIDQANQGQGYYDLDWLMVETTTDGSMAVIKDGLKLHVAANFVYSPTGNPQPGNTVAVAMPKNLWTVDRYVAIGSYGRPRSQPFTNIYLNYDPDSCLQAIEQLTTALNQLALPFELRVETDVDNYHRLEPLILIVASTDYPKAEALIRQIIQACPTRLATPIFTKKLQPGVAIAETNSLTDDFGLDCCLVIAEAIIDCLNVETISDFAGQEIITSDIKQALEKSGIILHQKYLLSNKNIYSQWQS
jgi:HopA1 effector protein family